jgi:hypothetical protein
VSRSQFRVASKHIAALYETVVVEVWVLASPVPHHPSLSCGLARCGRAVEGCCLLLITAPVGGLAAVCLVTIFFPIGYT